MGTAPIVTRGYSFTVALVTTAGYNSSDLGTLAGVSVTSTRSRTLPYTTESVALPYTTRSRTLPHTTEGH